LLRTAFEIIMQECLLMVPHFVSI